MHKKFNSKKPAEMLEEIKRHASAFADAVGLRDGESIIAYVNGWDVKDLPSTTEVGSLSIRITASYGIVSKGEVRFSTELV
jgi:hypothetical protein